MAKGNSALKRLRTSKKRAQRNLALRTSVKTAVKKVRQAVDEGSQDAQALLREACRTIDKVASKGAIHWKTAARKKSRIAKAVARLQKAASETQP